MLTSTIIFKRTAPRSFALVSTYSLGWRPRPHQSNIPIAPQYFWASCNRTYLEPLKHPPLSLVAREPQGCVSVDPLVYVPCAIRPGALGWYPEQGKVWQK